MGRTPMLLDNTPRLLVRSPNPLGDACMSLPAVRAMKRSGFDPSITVLCRENLLPLWEIQPEVDAVIAFPKGISPRAVGRIIRERNKRLFDAAVLLPHSLRSALEVRSAGIKNLIGYRGHWRSLLLKQLITDPETSAENQHHVHRYLHIAREIGADISDLDALLKIPPPPSPIPTNREDSIHLGICPGAEYGNAKRYPIERYAAAVKILKKSRPETPIRVSVFGSPAERVIAEELATLLGEPVTNRAGETSIAGLVDELRSCHFLATNDTGTMHLAAALGVPTVAIFGSTEPDFTSPIGGGVHRIIRHKVDCSPCFLRECPIDYRCMLRIEPGLVAREMTSLLGNGDSSPR